MSLAVKQPQHALLYSVLTIRRKVVSSTVILETQAARYSPNTAVSTVAVVQFKILCVCLCVWGVCTQNWTTELTVQVGCPWGRTRLVTCDLRTLYNQGSVAEVDTIKEQQLKRMQIESCWAWPGKD